ncbi:phosphoglycolate phosphatase [Spongiibacter sp. IMCC21906]|uniref:phosphoglycolate phosphatase n=1 Tax=Spongiibacter sp. IMCC21906 TaxID=1620392 RepID=UPI00062DE586|nr:phosphoglycolate phosphatase [Spongiibacter sp. IMCC21906]AKH69199.1 phosphoglycolate phosphatase [Spongiibacter sp. IMCC21906]
MTRLANLMAGRELKALLFDLDGTLIDSVPDLAAAVDASLEKHLYVPAGEKRIREWVGNGARKLVQRALAFALEIEEDRVTAGQVDELLASFFDFYAAATCERTCLYPGVLDSLEYWQQQGIAMACVTNKPERFSATILAGLKLDHYLPVLVGGDTLPQRKPDPAPLLLACERLGVAPENALMVGDSVNDVKAARAASIPVACVSYGYNHGEPVVNAKPDLVVDHFSQLLLP